MILSNDEELRLECARIGIDDIGARKIYAFIKESTGDAEILRAARAFAKEVIEKAQA